jgi:hypothetical protein
VPDPTATASIEIKEWQVTGKPDIIRLKELPLATCRSDA